VRQDEVPIRWTAGAKPVNKTMMPRACMQPVRAAATSLSSESESTVTSGDRCAVIVVCDAARIGLRHEFCWSPFPAVGIRISPNVVVAALFHSEPRVFNPHPSYLPPPALRPSTSCMVSQSIDSLETDAVLWTADFAVACFRSSSIRRFLIRTDHIRRLL
jgi:hypothetical protein